MTAEDATTEEKGGGFKGPPPRKDAGHIALPKIAPWPPMLSRGSGGSAARNDKPDNLPEKTAELSAPLLPSNLEQATQFSFSPLVSPAPKSVSAHVINLGKAILDDNSPDAMQNNASAVEPALEHYAVSAADGPMRNRNGTTETVGTVTSQTEAVEVMMDRVNRFERLNSDLANERTMLAWHRTCLAAMRTALAFVAVTALQRRWRDAMMIIAGAMSIVVIVTSSSGMIRYRAIKQILEMKDPPNHFGRPSNKYLNTVVLFASAATALAICVRAWDRE
jgi:uncharacterized membrane protein YidH (DUF202 family)